MSGSELARDADHVDLMAFNAARAMEGILPHLPRRNALLVKAAIDAISKARHYGIRPLMTDAKRKETA